MERHPLPLKPGPGKEDQDDAVVVIQHQSHKDEAEIVIETGRQFEG